ncbi:hypothetical protein B5M47_03695 [candidate division CPR3 bacterium 4484_211]|uniref:TIGR00725 family protein n=1 Tax=candidate division CPR3 bacterium 4484_211 TaxID=1968527 RepID=A0A1W9NX12_UNCC3|nr:MAG: hypothetical protein B5M47_03695 [candidate division CPR3 bacterium 4484_211]
MRIFVGGAWDPKRAKHFKEEIIELGRLLAVRGHDIILGPGSGVVRYVIDGFRNVADRKGKIIFYLPKEKELVRTGEELSPFADEVIRTHDSYLTRVVRMIEAADGFAAITGAAGTLYEMIGMMFMKKPVTILQESGGASNAACFLGGICEYVKVARTPQEMIDYLENSKIETNIPEEGIDWYDVASPEIKKKDA